MGTIVVRTSQELSDAFEIAEDGDRIELAPGEYGWIYLQYRDFDTGVTITSQDPDNRAVVTGDITIRNSSGVDFGGIDLLAGSLAESESVARVNLTSVEDVTVSDMRIQGHLPTEAEGRDPAEATGRMQVITGYGYETGLRIRYSSDVTVENVEIFDLRVGIGISESRNTVLRQVEIHDVREGINMDSNDTVLIADSYLHDFKPWYTADGGGDHSDMIQYWGSTGKEPLAHLTIRDSYFIQPESYTQSIFGHMRDDPGSVARDFKIINNVVVNAHTHGISLADVTGFEVTGNLVLPNDEDVPYSKRPSIMLERDTDGLIEGNTVVERYSNGDLTNLSESALSSAGITVQNNTILSDNPDVWLPYLEEVYASLPKGYQQTADGPFPAGAETPGTPEPEEPEETPDTGDTPDETPDEAAPGDLHLYLIDPETDTAVRELENADTISAADLADGVYNLSATYEGGSAGSIEFWLDGTRLATENNAPYAAFGDENGDFLAEALPADGTVQNFELRAYSGSRGSGTLIDSETFELSHEGAAEEEEAAETPEEVQEVSDSSDGPPQTGGAPAAAETTTTRIGGDGNDKLYDAKGSNTLMVGNGGADDFVFDYRSRKEAQYDVIEDLDFGEGDRLRLLGSEKGYFDDSVDPGNRLMAQGGGASAFFNSKADFAEAAAGGAISTWESDDGHLVIELAQVPGHFIEIQSLLASDLFA